MLQPWLLAQQLRPHLIAEAARSSLPLLTGLRFLSGHDKPGTEHSGQQHSGDTPHYNGQSNGRPPHSHVTGLPQHPAAQGAPAPGASSSSTGRRALAGTQSTQPPQCDAKFASRVWQQITTEMAKDPEVFSRNVDMLIRHCLRTSQAIPVDVLNHLLWLCKQHDDNQAAHALVGVLNAVPQQGRNHQTYVLLLELFTYFPKPMS